MKHLFHPSHAFPFQASLLACLVASSLPSFAAGNEGGSINLATALSRAVEKNPSLAAYDAEIRSAEARILSALARPNPELITEVEDVLGSGNFEGFDGAIYNLGIEQLIETGHKRKLRGEVSDARSERARLEFEVAKRELLVEVGQRFVDVLAAQEIEARASENLKIARDAAVAVQKQVEAGRGSGIDAGQAKIGENEARLSFESARLQTELKRQRLSALWGAETPDFSHASGSLSAPAGPTPELSALTANVGQHPSIALAEAGVSIAQRELSLEEKNRLPDVTVGVGYRRDEAVDDNAMVLGFSLPLPLFDRNEGGIAEAEANIGKSEAIKRSAETQLRLRISSARAEMEAARMAYQLVAGDMMRTATDHFEKLSEGFAMGRTRYLELLEARRSLLSVRKQRVEALEDYHRARVTVEALTTNPDLSK
ncbi:MAG: TolC family protein [Verrucomicrobiales bacterium]|nr:TolC family protein [Verrucomicrobiales bacterium]